MAGCASQPVVQATRQLLVVPEFYTVQSGESLSSIAAKFNLNYMDIARINNIEAIDKIYVNQSLRLKGSAQNVNNSVVKTQPIEQAVEIKRENATPIQIKPIITNSNPQQNINNTGSQVGLSQQKPNNTITKPVTPAPIVSTIQPQPSAQGQWVLPSRGPIIDTFDVSKDKKGTFFGGKQGDSIYAAKEGEVVYADDGLKEYGKLILIRHNQGYITAYAHNQQLIAKVGDRVRAGQEIAKMGSTGAEKVMLQFQIRLDGKPVDPQQVLPIK